MAVVKITSRNFETEVLQSEKPVLVDFWASWCGPCRMLSPLVEKLSEETDAVKVASIDVDSEDILAAKYGISSIPCLILFKNGAEADRSVGLIPMERLKAFAGI